MTGKTLIRIEGLTKRFGHFTAVDDVNLEIEEGEFFATSSRAAAMASCDSSSPLMFSQAATNRPR